MLLFLLISKLVLLEKKRLSFVSVFVFFFPRPSSPTSMVYEAYEIHFLTSLASDRLGEREYLLFFPYQPSRYAENIGAVGRVVMAADSSSRSCPLRSEEANYRLSREAWVRTPHGALFFWRFVHGKKKVLSCPFFRFPSITLPSRRPRPVDQRRL